MDEYMSQSLPQVNLFYPHGFLKLFSGLPAVESIHEYSH